jgi:hypothetical protein
METIILVVRYLGIIAWNSILESKKIVPEFKGGFMNWLTSSYFQILIFIGAILGIPNIGYVKRIVESNAGNIKWAEALLWIVFICVADFILNFLLIVPAKTYFGLKKEADKFTWNDIAIKKYRFPQETGNRIGVRVTNEKTISIQKFQALIGEIRLDNSSIKLKGDINIFPVVKGNFLDDRRVLATFHPKNRITIELANVVDGVGYITTSPNENDWIPMRTKVDYYLFISPNGDAGNEEGKCIFKPHSWEGKISFADGRLNLKIKNSLGYYW